MSEANKELARRWYEQVWNQKNEAAIEEMYHPNAVSHGFPNPDSVLVGPEGFKAIHRTFVDAFPDLVVHLEDIIAEGDRVAVRWKSDVTHLGDHLGFPASHRKASVSGSSFLTVKDGRIVEGWNHVDLTKLFQELKGLPA